MRFYIETLGCPKNTVDTEMMSVLLAQAGHKLVTRPKRADVIIVNTCGFIEPARQESVSALQELASHKRRHQLLVAAGCMAQRFGDDIRRLVPQVDALLGTRSWAEIAALFARLDREGKRTLSLDWIADEGNIIYSARRRPSMGATAYLKIADGCDAACAFCAIPLIKGPQRSKPVDEVLREARELVDAGVREIVLIAQDTTAYGRDLGEHDALPGLLCALADISPSPDWLRLMYTYPQHISPQLVETMAALPAVCHYVDMPLQHGHPDVLQRMRRPHDADSVLVLVDRLRDAMPDIALRSSFIVGYPGETEAEFEGLLEFMNEIAFDKVGVFGYSVEEGTPAADLSGRIPLDVIEARREHAMWVQQEISLARNQEQLGRELPILLEGTSDGLSVGRSYREAPEVDGMVLMPGELPVGEFIKTRIVAAQEYDLVAEAIL